MIVVTALRSSVAVFVATLIVLSYTSPTMAQFGQDGAAAGRLALGAMVPALAVWSTNIFGRAGLRRPWFFIVTFILALLCGGAVIVQSGVEGLAVGSTLLMASYSVLLIEGGWIRWRLRRRRRAGVKRPSVA